MLAYIWILVDCVQLEEGEDRNEKVHYYSVNCIAIFVALQDMDDHLTKLKKRVHEMDEAEYGNTNLEKDLYRQG